MDSDTESEEIKAPRKIKADTDCKNTLFSQSLKARAHVASSDFIKANRQSLKSMSGGKPLKPRFDVPDGFEIHPYGN